MSDILHIIVKLQFMNKNDKFNNKLIRKIFMLKLKIDAII